MKKKNNNKLLKPGTLYGICVKKGYIIIDGKFFNFELDHEYLGLDIDGDTIKTLKDKDYVTSILSTKITRIKILGEIDKNYNHFLKDNKIYHINANYISIGKSKFTYEITNKSKLNLDLVVGSAVTAMKTIDGEFVVKNTRPIFVSENFGNEQEVTCPIKITGYYKEISNLNKVRLNVIKGENRSSEIKDLLLVEISKICDKIIHTHAYKSGVITTQFIMLNGDMLYPRIESIETKMPTHEDVLYYVYNEKVEHPLGMYELKLYRLMERFILKVFPRLNQSIMSTKHFNGTPPIWTGEDTIKLMEMYESYYKEVKKLYKLAGLLSRLRNEKMKGRL